MFFLHHQRELKNPGSNVKVKLIADLMWVNGSPDNHSRKGVSLLVDIDKEEFLIERKPIDRYNRSTHWPSLTGVRAEGVGPAIERVSSFQARSGSILRDPHLISTSSLTRHVNFSIVIPFLFFSYSIIRQRRRKSRRILQDSEEEFCPELLYVFGAA